MVSNSGSYCQPFEVCQNKVTVLCWPCAHIPLEQGPCCAVFWAAAPLPFTEVLYILGFRLQILTVCYSREVAAGSSCPPGCL